MDTKSNPDLKENQEVVTPPQSQEEVKPLFSGTDSQGKERLFSTTEEAQQSWQSAQNFIKDKVVENKSLEERIQELEAQLNQSTKLDDALKQLKNKEESPVKEESNQQTTESTPQVDVTALTEQITQQIMGKLTESQQGQVKSQNQEANLSAAKALYGDSYEERLRESAKELGMSDEDIVNEAQSSPARFKRLFGLDRQPKTNYSPSNSVSGFNQKKEAQLDLSRGFNDRQRVGTAIENYRKIAEKQGAKLNF